MLKYSLIGCLLLLVSYSCSYIQNKSEDKLPVYILSKQTLTEVLTDIHLIEAVLLEKQNQGVQVVELSVTYYDSLFAKHNISKAQLDSSLIYYGRHPEILEAVYTQVITNLSKLETARDLPEVIENDTITDVNQR